MTTSEQRLYQHGDRVTWRAVNGSNLTGIVARPDIMPAKLVEARGEDLTLVDPDGAWSPIWLPTDSLDYAPPIPPQSYVTWPDGEEGREGRVATGAHVVGTDARAKVRSGELVPVLIDDALAPVLVPSRGMRIIADPVEVSRRQADALLTAISTAQRAMNVVATEGRVVTAHGAWEPGDFSAGIATEGDFEAELERAQEALRALFRMARLAGTHR